MGGGLMQLVAYGAQDIYLTGNPQITFFKVVYRRHTNFSMEAIEQTWNGTPEGTQGRATATISRNGDLVSRMYLELTGELKANTANPGIAGIVDVELEIGGQKIDKQSGLWMELWSELTEINVTHYTGVLNGTVADNKGTQFQVMSGSGGCKMTNSTDPKGKLFVPLQFWFCRNPGLALPLIALQYHEVKVILNHKLQTNSFTGSTLENKLWVDYIYLDTDERRRFAQVSHEYLIEQVQEQTLGQPGGSSTLNFNHPVKELIWTRNPDTSSAATAGQPRPVVDDASGNFVPCTYQIKLNGHDRFAQRDFRYFTRTQVWQYHTGVGGLATTAVGDHGGHDSIAVYSFALKPEEHQPSGTCNFSRIDNAQLVGSSEAKADKIFAVNYNVLRIMSGMGGLAYSN